MTSLQLRVIQSAVAIRVRRGEDIFEVLASYTRLTDEERYLIYSNLV